MTTATITTLAFEDISYSHHYNKSPLVLDTVRTIIIVIIVTTTNNSNDSNNRHNIVIITIVCEEGLACSIVLARGMTVSANISQPFITATDKW